MKNKPFYTSFSFRVLAAVAIAIVFGYVSPAHTVAMPAMQTPQSLRLRSPLS